jgi:glycerol-3-phosphate dehydrogenase
MTLRESNLDKLDQDVFDVLIVGGGINGAVSASALTSQGADVALIDRGDFAGFTSQSSSNLVWGGIKYLEGLEFGLVRKLCKSRNQLINSYPSSVKEIRFFVSLAKAFRHHRFFLFMGSLLYWFMGNLFTRAPRLLSRKAIEREEPVVNTSDCQGGIEYSDAYLVDNDARFVFGFIREAINHGGIVVNYVEAIGSKQNEDGVWETEIEDRLTGTKRTIRSRVLLNTCGPFADQYNTRSDISTEHHHLFSKGIHLIVDRITEAKRVLTFFADDGRMFFTIPMGAKSCIGTTDTRVDALPPRVTEEDREFVLENINKRLNLAHPLTKDDIIAERCGVRPLVVEPRGDHGDEGDWTSLSRKHVVEVQHHASHISIFGGKLTDCINVGDEICAYVEKLGVKLPYSGKKWYGEPSDEIKEEYFHQARLMDLDELTVSYASEPLSTRLWRRYGTRALDLLEDIRRDPAMGEVLIEGTEYLRCEIHHAADHEMITKLEDFLRRRSKIALVVHTNELRDAPGLLEACKILFGDNAQTQLNEYFASLEA